MWNIACQLQCEFTQRVKKKNDAATHKITTNDSSILKLIAPMKK